MTILQTIAANIAAAQASVDSANDAASVVKFNALADFAAGVAMRLRVEHINKGSNLETDGKGRIVALRDISKDQRAALVTALEAAGVKERDAANIGSMGRTVALHFVAHMVETGSIRLAKSGDEMREIIAESLKEATGGAETYNAVEKARSRKFAPPPAEVEASEEEAPNADSLDMGATLDTAPEPATAPTDDGKADPEEVLTAEVATAVRILTAALDRGDIERLIANGFRSVLSEGLSKVQAFEQERERERLEAEAAALEALAEGKRRKAG